MEAAPNNIEAVPEDQPKADAWVDNRLQAFAKEQRELC
jgi:hypothetical protein